MAKIGAIADDYTGATDLAGALVRAGMRVTQLFGVPAETPDLSGTDAVVVALKTRSASVEQAIATSLQAADYLESLGAQRWLFKICSTFDSTSQGNIGPVAEQLLARLQGRQAIVCPAFPTNGRTQYMGHLFVFDQPLHESGMRHHPLTPMTDSNLLRVLQSQTKLNVGLVPYLDVAGGAERVTGRLEELAGQGIAFALTDALTNQHLKAIALASGEHRLIVGGSAIAEYMPDVWRAQGLLGPERHVPRMPDVEGRQAVLSGSCSEMTQRQVAEYARQVPCYKIDVLQPPSLKYAQQIAQWAVEHHPAAPLITTTPDVTELRKIQAELGARVAAERAEHHLLLVAQQLAQLGFRRLVVAGGETSGSIVNALGVTGLRIGPEICTGVPWTESVDGRYALSLKSGNFGDVSFFQDAWRVLG